MCTIIKKQDTRKQCRLFDIPEAPDENCVHAS